MRLIDYTCEAWIDARVKAKDRDAVLVQLVHLLKQTGDIAAEAPLVEALKDREKLMSTGIGGGIAIPHAMSDQVDRTKVCIGRIPEGVDFSALDGKPVYLVFLLLAPHGSGGEHVKLLARIARLIRKEEAVSALRAAERPEQILGVIDQYDT